VQRIRDNGEAAPIYNYNAFGNEKSSVETDPNPFRYCAEYWDKETESYYLRARSYFPSTGRFTQEDPISDGLNWYAYCGNNPVMFTDRSGLAPTALEAAYMADHIYEDLTKDNYGEKLAEKFGGWTLINIMKSVLGGSLSNLKIGIYSRTIDGITEYAMVNKGTTPSSGNDWINNITGPAGFSSDMRESIGYARVFDKRYEGQELTMIGHSKGGAEAIANAVATGRNAITFNPMSPNLKEYSLDGSSYTGTMIHYVVKGDILNTTFGTPSVGATSYLKQQFKTPWVLKYSIFGGPINPIKNHYMSAVINALKEEGSN